jgi:quinoprotein glucose dehydrogenase
VPGESSAQSQPFPTKPRAFSKQGFTYNDLIDFTPELKSQALDAIKGYRVGPLYTPPSMDGTVMMPGVIGGAGWGGGAFDPANGTIFIKASNSPALLRIRAPQRSDSLDAPYSGELGLSLAVVPAQRDSGGRSPSLPINKPPYGTLTAIDLTTGEHRWQVPLGDSPTVRNHPALKGLELPPLLGVAGSPGPIVTAGGVVFVTGGGSTLYAIDTQNGSGLWSANLGQNAYSVPMTYRTKAGKQFVVVAVGAANGAKLMAFALP